MQKTSALIVLLLFSTYVFGQQSFKISSPKLKFENNILTVEYNLTNCSVNDVYFVDLEIVDSKGNEVDARSLTGDLGQNIKCGRDKKIFWNLEEDNFLLNDEIEVQVIVEKIATINPELSSISPQTKTLSRGGVIGSSLLFPGLGQKKASGKSAFLILGALSYGSAGASLYYHNDHKKKYDLYLNEPVKEESDRLFAESESSFNTSRALMYGAIGLWTTNIIWSALIPIKDPEAVAISITPNSLGGMEMGAIITF